MEARKIWQAMVEGGHLIDDPEFLLEAARQEAEFEQNSFWVRALLYRLPQLIDEYDFLLEDTEDELMGMDEETYALWNFAHADDGVDIDPETEEIVA